MIIFKQLYYLEYLLNNVTIIIAPIYLLKIMIFRTRACYFCDLDFKCRWCISNVLFVNVYSIITILYGLTHNTEYYRSINWHSIISYLQPSFPCSYFNCCLNTHRCCFQAKKIKKETKKHYCNNRWAICRKNPTFHKYEWR